MDYFEDISFSMGDHVPDCRAWIDRRFPDYGALNFAYQGRIRLQGGGGRMLVLPAPVAWWTWPGPRFVYGAVPGEGWNHFYQTFHGPRAQRWFNGGLLPREEGSAWRRVASPERFAEDFTQLLDWVRQGKQAAAVLLFESMALRLHESEVEAEPDHLQNLRRLMDQIDAHPERKINLAMEARRMHVSVRHLTRLFHQHAGISPYQYLLRARLATAARLLRQTDLPIKYIATQVGYPDIYHFSKIFKQHLRLPPGQYRHEARSLSGTSSHDQPEFKHLQDTMTGNAGGGS